MDYPVLSPVLGKVGGVSKIPPNALPSMVAVKRSDPVYMAHAYLTKVPVAGIVPFIEAFTKEGDTVLDPFAGSGMTGVAALMTGRRARLYDVSVLGRHIGTNYVNLVPEEHLRKRADEVLDAAAERVGEVYSVSMRVVRRPRPGRQDNLVGGHGMPGMRAGIQLLPHTGGCRLAKDPDGVS